MAHFCNPSYSGSGDMEDCGLKGAQAKSSQDSISTNKCLMWNYAPVNPAIQEE
jgi:hypothetical protein